MSETNTIQMSNRARNAGQKLAAAFIDEHGCKPSEAVIEFGRLPNGKSTLRIRKLTEIERAAALDMQVKRDQAAWMKLQDVAACVWMPQRPKLWAWMGRPKAYMSEAGAAAASRNGKARRIEVRP